VPSSGTGKGLLIGGGIGLAVVLAGLLVLKPWQKPTPVEPPVSAAPAPTELAGTGTPPATNPTPVNPPAQPTAAPAAEAPVHGTPEEAGSRIHPQPSNASSPPPTNIRVAAPSAAQLAKDRAAYEQMRRNVDLARQQAVTLGASVTDLSGGDISVANATTNASRDRYDEAMTQLGEASTIYVTAASSARQRAAAAAQQQAAVPVPVPAAPAAEAVADDRGAIELVLSQYFRAVSAGKLDRMKELFPTMPTDVQATYRDLFKSGSSIDTSNWEVISTDLKGAKAVVQINGQTTLRDKKGKILAQSPAPKSINLEKVSGAWRIGDVHQ
jgi:hypothetical protein